MPISTFILTLNHKSAINNSLKGLEWKSSRSIKHRSISRKCLNNNNSNRRRSI